MNRIIAYILGLVILFPASVSAEPFTYFGPENAARLREYHDLAASYYRSLPTTTEHEAEPVRGIFVNYFIHNKNISRGVLSEEFRKMRSAGIIGVSLEVTWREIEPLDGQFTFPSYLDMAMEEAAANDLLVSLLIAPHYAPDWLYSKHGDIYIYDQNGNRYYHDNMGTDVDINASYINYSFYSPAVADQTDFQKHAFEYYAKYPHLYACFLGNEQIYDRNVLIDQSSWAKKAWSIWLSARGEQYVEMPETQDATSFGLWQEFRAENLNTYLTTVYEEVSSVNEKHIPLGHRMLLYHSFSSEAPMYAYQPDLATGMDVVGNDNYSFSLSSLAFQTSFDKPVFIGETSLMGEWREDDFYGFLMTQYYMGADIQSVYLWNPSPYRYALTTLGGDLTEKGKAVKKAAEDIADLPLKERKTSPVAIVVPNAKFLEHGADFRNHQYLLDDIIEFWLRTGIKPRVVWKSDVDQTTVRHMIYVNPWEGVLQAGPFAAHYIEHDYNTGCVIRNLTISCRFSNPAVKAMFSSSNRFPQRILRLLVHHISVLRNIRKSVLSPGRFRM